MAFILIFNKELTVDGLIYPAGAIVPAGKIKAAMISSLRDSNRIIEIREEELGASVPLPHRVPTISGNVLASAKAHEAEKRAQYEAAKKHLDEVQGLWDYEHDPVDESELVKEPETRGTTTDFEGIAAAEAEAIAAAPVAEEEVSSEVAEDVTSDGDDIPSHVN